jgi:choice-of-anchor A domain-containing protein/prepilin-type N-terminal cleavage/methylation domain-containing protein
MRDPDADHGVTLVELTVVIAIIGVITTVISGGIVVLLRSNPVVSRSIAQSHDQQQLLNYLYEDVRATESVDVNTSYDLFGYTREAGAPGCPSGSDGPNVLQLTWREDTGVQRSSYRLVNQPSGGAYLQRDHCEGASVAALGAASVVNVADQLESVPAGWNNTGAPAHVGVEGDVVTIVLAQLGGRELRASATLRGDLALIPLPTPSTTPPTTAVPTTTTVPEPTTSTTTTTTGPGVLDGVCDLLASITGVLQTPTAATALLRDWGADGVAGALTTSVRVDARVSASVSISLLELLSLDVSLCASVQLAFNTGTTEVRIPLQAEPECILQVVLCLSVRVSLSAELAVSASELWTDGAHPIWLAKADGSVVAGSTTTVNVSLDPASGPPPAPITVPTVGQGEALNPLAAAQGFSVMVEGSTLLSGVSVKGAVAAGGQFRFSRYGEVAATSASTATAPGDPSPLGLMVGGDIDLGATPAMALEVRTGFAHAGATPGGKVLTNGSQTHVVPTAATGTTSTPRLSVVGANQTDQAAYPIVRPLVFPFTNTFLALDRSSSGMGALTPGNCPAASYPELYSQYGNWILNLVAGRVNVLNLTSKQVADMGYVNGSGTLNATTTLVINVTDHGNVSIPARYWPQLQPDSAHPAIVWNFPNANKLTVSGVLYGSLFAPTADVTLASVQVHGDVVAASLTTTGDSTINLDHFDRQVPCIG